ncbi:MAG: anti-sigma factor family protein, partial [Mycobacteriales bacterium]
MRFPTCVHMVDVGAYVLGALDPAERSAVEQHLPTCAACSAELSDLAGLPGLLSRLSPAEAEQASSAPPVHLLDAMLSRARRRRHRLRLGAAVAASVSVLGLGTGIGLAATQSGPHAAVLTATAGSIDARATLHAVAAGTEIDLHLDGVPADTRCRL